MRIPARLQCNQHLVQTVDKEPLSLVKEGVPGLRFSYRCIAEGDLEIKCDHNTYKPRLGRVV